jgi:hypothetical protein
MKKATALIVLLPLLAVTPGLAADFGFGPRVGYTSSGNLDQLHFGGHAEFRHVGNNLHLIPSLEVGSGDGTLIAVNGDLVYEFTELATATWSMYGGGGPVLTRYDGDGGDQTDFALNLVLGTNYTLGSDRDLFGEIRLGIEDAPDLKLTVGLTFR